MKNRVLPILIGTLLFASAVGLLFFARSKNGPVKLYWLIPDGVRAEPDLFTIFRWAQDGKLPNFKKMMDEGSYGYSIPVFPSHTPVNFATLLTGAMPRSHGVSDGPMHIEGAPLNQVSVGGFRSVARRIPAVWTMLENSGKKVAVISTPGSTPPESDQSIVIRGRWGGWGADLHSVNYESVGSGEMQVRQGRRARLFNSGPKLAQYLEARPAQGWKFKRESSVPPLEIEMSDWGQIVYGYIYGTPGSQGYDRVVFSPDKITALDDLSIGEWGKWHEVELRLGDQKVPSHYLFHVIKLGPDGFFRIRILFDNLNSFITQPSHVAADLESKLGPMVDFVDNFPAQLVYYPEDRSTFLKEMGLSFDWHTRAIGEILHRYQPDAVIHDVYNPNQMLTSRWWLGKVDPEGWDYQKTPPDERELRFAEVLQMYKRLDGMLGEVLKNTDSRTLVVFSSDHGAHVLNRTVHINNILTKNGLLFFKIDPKTGEPVVDWGRSKAVFLQMHGIFLGPRGLAGNWQRSKGAEYERLRDKVIGILSGIRDDRDQNPVGAVTKWEDVESVLDLPKDRVGDLVISNVPGYGWTEEMSSDLKYFSTPLESGYKQAILKESTKATWTPFLIMGPGVKKSTALSQPIRQIDQLPTILRLMGIPAPSTIEGHPLDEIIQ